MSTTTTATNSFDLGNTDIRLTAQRIFGDIYDLTNDRHFRFTIYFISNFKPYMCVEQLYGN